MGTNAQDERTFGIDELFFSTTDEGGRILAGNPVFVRVSAYAAEELQGKAHNIVRHPDMPRVVFRLLWQYLRDSRPIAAYVKNRAKDGRHYWVVATVVPIPGGYLSVRFKPSGPHFPIVEGLYAQLLDIERAVEQEGGGRDAAMDAAQDHLVAALAGLGLPDYDAFMHHFMAAEVRSRDAAIVDSPAWQALWHATPAERLADPTSAALADILDGFRGAYGRMNERFADIEDYVRLNDALGNQSRDLVGEMRLQSLNMMLTASRLGREGASLSAVAQLMASEAVSAAQIAGALHERGGALDGVLRELGFRIAVGRLQAEMAVFFTHEMLQAPASGGANRHDLAGNVALLSAALADTLGHVVGLSTELGHALGHLDGDISMLSGLLSVLDALQLNGRIEATRIAGAESALDLLEEMRGRVQAANSEIDDLASAARTARTRTRRGGDRELEGRLEEIARSASRIAA